MITVTKRFRQFVRFSSGTLYNNVNRWRRDEDIVEYDCPIGIHHIIILKYDMVINLDQNLGVFFNEEKFTLFCLNLSGQYTMLDEQVAVDFYVEWLAREADIVLEETKAMQMTRKEKYNEYNNTTT